MVMEAGSPQISLVPGLLERVNRLITFCQDVPLCQQRCKLLAEHMKGLLPFLEEMKTSQIRISNRAQKTFMGLMYALLRTEKLVEKIKHTSKLKRVFMHTQYAEDLRKATTEILDLINDLPMVQFKISFEKEEEIKKLKLKLEELKDIGPNKEEHDFIAEVTEVLRAHNNGGATTSRGMDDLLKMLARRFDSDVETVRREWQELKEESALLREEIEYTTETKRKMEDEFIRQVSVYIGREQEQTSESPLDASSSTFRERPTPEEFRCPICREVMTEPVVCATGQTYCKECIKKWYENNPGKESCPITNILVQSNILIENIALRSLISRWTDGRLRGVQHLYNDELLGAAPPSPAVDVPLEPVCPAPNNMPARILSLDSLVSSLQSNKAVEIRKSLKQLALIAQHPSGQREIYSSEVIPVIAGLLDSDNQQVVERAANALEAVTFESRGEASEHLNYDEREEILNSVTEHALGSLIRLLHIGSQLTRLKAAQTLINLLADHESRAEVSRRDGVVQGFFGLTNISSGVLFPSEGKSLCIKGLTLLGGEKYSSCSSPDSDSALARALIRLAGILASTPKLVEETLVALSLLVDMVEPGVRASLLQKKDISFLIRLYRAPRLPSVRRGHSSSQSSVLTELGKKEVLNILDDLSSVEGQPQVLVECGLSSFLLTKITDSEAETAFVIQGIKVLWRCISSIREKFTPFHFQIDFQMEMKGIVSILGRDQIPAGSKVEMLLVLVHLCGNRDVDPLRESFLKVDGISALEVLARSSVVALREEVALMLRLLAEFHPSREEFRTPEGAMLLMSLLEDDRPTCRGPAVVALASIIKSGEWDILIEAVRFEQLVDLLRPTYSSECRESATSVLSEASQKLSGTRRDSNVKVLRETTTIQLLLDVVQTVGADAKFKAAELLIDLAVQDPAICSSLVDGGLSLLIEFGVQLGGAFRDKVVQLLKAFSQGGYDTRNCVMKVDGVSLLVDALEIGKSSEEASVASSAAIALSSLVNYGPAREAAIEAGLVEKAIRCISGTWRYQLMELIGMILDNKTIAERIRKAKGVEALVRVLTVRGPNMEKRLAASVLAKLIKLDPEAQPILRGEKGISSLNELLIVQARDANPSCYFGGRMEALDALSAATEDQDNLLILLTEHCIEPLLSILSRESLSSVDEELVLLLLWKLSRGALTSGSTVNFMVERLSKHVVRVTRTGCTSSDLSVETAICIIRNISLFGPTDRAVLANEDEGVVKLLLDRISNGDAGESTNVVSNAVIALERFMLEDKGRTSFISGGGIPILIRFLNRDVTGQAKSFAMRILVMLAASEDSPKDICTAIWECKSEFLNCLGDILELGPRADCKSEAAKLLKYLIMSGPRADVCRSISESRVIHKLMDLKGDPGCVQSATEALEALYKYQKDSRISPWFRFHKS